ncbi:MAG: hypothetical protein L0K86_22820, partial [Actinomycetia bacterium]|nr:hypothetical protein [Actinomycetes bacterium]
SLAVLDRLALLYGCDVADLVADWGCHAGSAVDDTEGSDAAALAWQVAHLSVHELAQSIGAWGARLPERQRRMLLQKLSTASSLATSAQAEPPSSTALSPAPTAMPLIGVWSSTYTYDSTSRGRSFTGNHVIELRQHDSRLLGQSEPHPTGSILDLDLAVEGSLATGTWTEQTSPSGHYRAATFQGVLHLVGHPTGHTMRGRWLGVSRQYTIKSGEWRLDRQPVNAGPVTTATTVDPSSNSPAATLA